MTTIGRPGRSLLTRVLSLEGAMGAFGLYSLGTGLWFGEMMSIFWGGTILVGLCLLVLVRRRDWQSHWEEMERSAAREARRQVQDPPETPSSKE